MLPHLYMMYVWGHSHEFPYYENWDTMEAFCRLAGRRDDIWYATNIQIVDYMDAAKRLQFGADMDMVYNPSVQSVWISKGGKGKEIKGGQMLKI